MAVAPQQKFHVMISYNQESGTECMNKIYSKLKNIGYKVWIDEREVFSRLNDDIPKGVDSSCVMVALISAEYEKSEWCMDEVRFAKKLKKPIIPVKVSNYNPPGDSPLNFILSDRVYCKMYGRFDEIEKLVDIVKRHLARCEGISLPEQKSTQESTTKEDQKIDKAAASETEERISEDDTRTAVDERGKASPTETDGGRIKQGAGRSDNDERGKASAVETDGGSNKHGARRSDADVERYTLSLERDKASSIETDGGSNKQDARRSDADGEEALAESFDVILSFDLTTGKKDKNKVFGFLTDAGLSVCNCNERKLFDFPEYWCDRMAGSSVVILLLSSNFFKSEPCRQQFDAAKKARKKIIAIKTEKSKHENPELEKLLSDVKSYKIYQGFAANMNKVVGAVKEHVTNAEPNRATGSKTSGRVESSGKDRGGLHYAMGSSDNGRRKADEGKNNGENKPNGNDEDCRPSAPMPNANNKSSKRENRSKTNERDESFSDSGSSQQYAMGSNGDGRRKANDDRSSRENTSNYRSENYDSNVPNSNSRSWMPTINVFGGNVVFGDAATINIASAAPSQSYKTEEDNVASKPRHAARKSYPTSFQETSYPSEPDQQAPKASKEIILPLSREEAHKQGLERSMSDFTEDIRDELAAKLGDQSAVVASWINVARALHLESNVIQKIEVNCTAHRLLFMRIRDGKPDLKLSVIKDILENKMKRKPRKDIFYDYDRNKELPALDREIGSLNNSEFELVLENVADRLVTDRVRGHWRNLGGFLGFSSSELDEISVEGKPENFTGSARMFIDFLGFKSKKVKEFIDALESVKRNDIALFIKQHLECDDCWIESCAMQSHYKSKLL